jgi:hypothetical protein
MSVPPAAPLRSCIRAQAQLTPYSVKGLNQHTSPNRIGIADETFRVLLIIHRWNP